MRLLHVNPGNLYGGIETLLVTLARHRAQCPGMEPHFALCFEGRLSEELRAAGAAVHLLGGVRVSWPWTVWRARRRLAALLAAQPLDAVLCHGCWPHALAAPVARRHSLPVVFYAHNLQGGRHWLERWARWTPPDLVLSNSRATAATIAALFGEVPNEVIYLPVAPAPLADRQRVRAEVRQALATAADTTVIFQASRLEAWKGHALLLEALARLADVPAWECWIAGGAQRTGEEAYLTGLQAAAARAGLACRVRFLGQRSDVPRLLAAADIHCQPNTGPEPFGIAFIEALSAGVPVVTTALGGALEIVDETCGRLVSPGDAAALAAVLQEWILDPGLRRRLAAGGPARAQALCDPQTQMGQMLDALRRLSRARHPCLSPLDDAQRTSPVK